MAKQERSHAHRGIARLLALVSGALTAGIVLLGFIPASAHSASNFYSVVYGAGSLPDVIYRFTQSVPNTTFRARVEDGADKWTAVGGVNLDFIRGNITADNFDHENCGAGPTGVSTIHHVDIGGPRAYGITVVCLQNNGTIREFQLALGQDVQDWNITTAAPASNEVDVWAVAAHEFGHATGGWLTNSDGGHFNQVETCPQGINYSGWETMCNSIDILTTDTTGELGKQFRRTLEDHDKHTFQDAY